VIKPVTASKARVCRGSAAEHAAVVTTARGAASDAARHVAGVCRLLMDDALIAQASF
jgi:hypothetical protein